MTIDYVPIGETLKVYIAAPYGARAQARRYADQMTEHGVEITSQWVTDPEL